MKKILMLLFLVLCPKAMVFGQHLYGTTGLLHAPTAEMQRGGTFMLGGGMIDHNIYRSGYWSRSSEYKPYTYNYFVNITFFPWMEVGYTCTLVKGAHNSSYWPKQTWGKFVNQDRSFHLRLRAWKEGWWKDWTPQIVVGTNDPGSHESAGGGNITFDNADENTNHLTRFFVAATKHFTFSRWGELGLHASVIQFDGPDFGNEHGVTAGASFRFGRPQDGFRNKALNGLKVMGEYYDGAVNVGGEYSMWKDRINVVASLYDGKYWSVGLYLRVHLK